MERYIFFDLDGTLTDSAPGIVKAVTYSLEQLGIPLPPAEVMHKFVGPPLLWSFSNFYGMSEEESKKAVEYYRECYSGGEIYNCLIYDGFEDLLKALNEKGVKCVLATSKPHVFANAILEKKGLAKYFCYVSGPEFDGTRDAKSEVIAYAMEQLGLTDPSTILMVGDRDHDTKGAVINGVDSVGALWGFGDAEELLSTGAKAVFETPRDLMDRLCAPDFEAF